MPGRWPVPGRCLLDALPTNLCQPTLERFCLRRGDGLDDAQDALGIGGLHLSLLAVCGEHLSRGTNCTPVGRQLQIAGAHLFDVLLGVSAFRQDRNNILHGEVPFFLFLVPGGTDLSTPVFPPLPILQSEQGVLARFRRIFSKNISLIRNFSLNALPDALCFFGYSYIMYCVA